MRIPLPLPFFLVIVGFTINTINYGLLTERIKPIMGFSGHENVAYLGAFIIFSGVATFIHFLFQKDKH